MIKKNEYKVYRKYEGDERKDSYNYDMIIERIMEVAESLDIEDRLKDYVDDLEYITEQIVDELNDANSELDDLQQDYDDLEEEKEDLEREIRYLKDILEEQENSENGRKE